MIDKENRIRAPAQETIKGFIHPIEPVIAAMKPLEVIEEAISQINTYKHPNIDDAREIINAVSGAAGLGSPGGDHISSMEISGDFLRVRTEYSVRCCSMSDDFHIPVFLFEAEDPVLAAEKWAYDNELDNAKAKVLDLEKSLDYARNRLAEVVTKGRP